MSLCDSTVIIINLKKAIMVQYTTIITVIRGHLFKQMLLLILF